jgi:muramoyltetrapeptide carboxypeptidase
MATAFEPLRRDEPIGVVALSGPASRDDVDRGLDVLREWGNPLVIAPNVASHTGYLAGDDGSRLRGLEHVLDSGARVVFALRGGYGVTRLLQTIPWRRLVTDRVTFVGFSDLTAAVNPLVHRGGAVQFHGPMVAAGLGRPENARRIHSLLTGGPGDTPLFRFSEASVVRQGRAEGVAMGGNLSMLCALQGTAFAPDLDGRIVFLEDVGEPLYRLDRMLTHLVGSGTLRRVKALISGSLRGCQPATGRARRWPDLLAEAAPAGVPVVVGLPFGHGAKNLAFPIGATIRVSTSPGLISWSG